MLCAETEFASGRRPLPLSGPQLLRLPLASRWARSTTSARAATRANPEHASTARTPGLSDSGRNCRLFQEVTPGCPDASTGHDVAQFRKRSGWRDAVRVGAHREHEKPLARRT